VKVKVNEKWVVFDQKATLFCARDGFKPSADVLILNGAVMADDALLVDGDEISLITRGEMPTQDELESLMVARHTPGVHEKLKAATVGVAGLGGLGSSVAVALARVGVGKLILADFDVVEPSNLNRQQYFVDQIGLPKTEALGSSLKRMNPYVEIESHLVRLAAENVLPVFGDVDVMIEAFDGADQKAMLLQAFVSARPNTPFVGASGMAGYASGETIGIKKMGRNIHIVGDLETGAEPGCGLMAPRVGVAANMQANLALRLIMG
jgi:sulfur carrier protein ThiS adenylyltransferase